MTGFSPASLFAIGFGLGKLPGAPGTWGSLAALPLAWWVGTTYGQLWLVFIALCVFAAGARAASLHARKTRQSDPGEIVIDEVAGQLLTLAAAPMTIWSLIAGFLLFRLFDIVKPWPVNLADRKIKGGLGIMLDDMLAGLYAGAALYLLDMWVF